MESQDFILKTEYIDLSQLLKATGLAMSGGEAKMFVTEGMVFVNDEIEFRKREDRALVFVRTKEQARINSSCKMWILSLRRLLSEWA